MIPAAESSANHLIALYLHPQRATRLIEQHARDRRNPGLQTTINALFQATWFTDDDDSYLAEIGRVTEKLVLQHLKPDGNQLYSEPSLIKSTQTFYFSLL